MGLSLEVGILADLATNDPEAVAGYEEYFASVNELLAEARLAPHREPNECEIWSADMFSYSGLHYLRRVAAHLDARGELPIPGGSKSSEDPVLEGHFDDFIGASPGLFRRLFASKESYSRRFDHLIVHSDAEGFYLPADFPKVLLGDDDDVPGGMVGSAPRLLGELDHLASVLEVPPGLESQSDALWDAVESQGEGDETWQRYAIETFSCVTLREGCRRSIATGAALVFC